MKRIKRKIKEIMSRPGKNLKKMKKSVLVFAESALQMQTASPTRQSSMKLNFSFEEEAAQLAYRQGWDIPTHHAYLANGIVGSDFDEEFTPESTKDKDIIVRDKDEERLIGKLKMKISIEDKEDWESLYA